MVHSDNCGKRKIGSDYFRLSTSVHWVRSSKDVGVMVEVCLRTEVVAMVRSDDNYGAMSERTVSASGSSV